MKYRSIFFGLLLTIMSLPQLDAAYTIKDGCLVNTNSVPEFSAEEHYNAAVEAYNQGNWIECARHFFIVMEGFPQSAYAQESAFYLAVCYYNLAEYDQANATFTLYLQGKDHPRLFQESIEYKFAIAEKFRSGARRRLFGYKELPKWATGGTLALSIYDEVIAALPCNDLAAQALYAKALLLRSRRDFRESIECLQVAVRRFPKHELAPEFYLLINQIYLDQCRLEFQNPDILAFAEINFRRFKQNFPKEERLAEAESDVQAIKEVYGGGLSDTGYFYERIQRPRASVIYYQTAIRLFPDTYAAEFAKSRLIYLGYEVPASTCTPNVDQDSRESNDQIDALEEANDDSEEAAEENMDDKAINWIP